MKKILILILLLSQTSCELLQLNKNKALDCSVMESLHPKNQAVCILKTEIKLLRNSKLKTIVGDYKNQGLRNSENYEVSLMSGGGNGEELSWTYLVSVSFNNLKKYQSVIGLVDIYASKSPRLIKIISSGDLK